MGGAFLYHPPWIRCGTRLSCAPRVLRVNTRSSSAAVYGVAALCLAAAGSGQQHRRMELPAADAVAEVGFTRVTSVRELGDGSVLVADHAEERLVLVQWRSGEVRIIGRVGNGPGEYRAVGWLYPLAGDSTLLTDSYSGRWLLLDGTRIAGTVSEQRPLNRLLPPQLFGADRMGQVLSVPEAVVPVRGPNARRKSDSLALILAERVSQRVDTFGLIKGRGSEGFQARRPSRGRPGQVVLYNPLASQDKALLFLDGWVAIARAEPYRVDWRAPDGRWVHGAPLPFVAVKASDREKCWAMERWFGRVDPCDPAELPGWPEVMPPFVSLWPQGLEPVLLAGADGHLVIARTPSAASPEHRYDVVDRQGRLAGFIPLPLNESLIGFGVRSAYVLSVDGVGLQTLRRHPWP